MKIINKKRTLDDLLTDEVFEEKIDLNYFYDDFEEKQSSPCWEVKIDREKGYMRFLIDGKEQMACKLSKIDKSFLTIKKISMLIGILRTGELNKIKTTLGIK